MKGILLKDIYTLGSYKKNFLFILCIALAFGIFMPQSSIYISNFFIIYLIQPALGLFTFDESAKWNTYATALPVPRKCIVISRYIAAILPALFFLPLSIIFSAGLGFAKGESDYLLSTLATSAVALVMFLLAISISFPFAYKYGIEKARVAMMGVYFGIFAIIMIPLLLFKEKLSFLNSLTSGSVAIAGILLFLFLLASLAISISLSIKTYETKDF